MKTALALFLALTVGANSAPVPKPNPSRTPSQFLSSGTTMFCPMVTGTVASSVQTVSTIGATSIPICTFQIMPRRGHMQKFWRLTKFDHDLSANLVNRPYIVRGPLFDDRLDCTQAISDLSKQYNSGDGLFCASEWKWIP